MLTSPVPEMNVPDVNMSPQDFVRNALRFQNIPEGENSGVEDAMLGLEYYIMLKVLRRKWKKYLSLRRDSKVCNEKHASESPCVVNTF